MQTRIKTSRWQLQSADEDAAQSSVTQQVVGVENYANFFLTCQVRKNTRVVLLIDSNNIRPKSKLKNACVLNPTAL